MDKYSDKLFIAFIRLTRQFHREGHKHVQDFHDHKMHRGQAHLLKLISENEGAKQMELAEIMDMRPSSMTEMLARLEQSELIVKKQDENDQRVMRIFLTEKGKEALKESSSAFSEMSQSIFSSLTEEEQAQLLGLLEKLTENLDDSECREDRCGFGRHGHHGHGFFHFRGREKCREF